MNLAALKLRVEELKTRAEVARLQADGACHPQSESSHLCEVALLAKRRH